VNQYVCDRCGHRWQETHVIRCPKCCYEILHLWQGDGAEANAKAQALRISRRFTRERSEAVQ